MSESEPVQNKNKHNMDYDEQNRVLTEEETTNILSAGEDNKVTIDDSNWVDNLFESRERMRAEAETISEKHSQQRNQSRTAQPTMDSENQPDNDTTNEYEDFLNSKPTSGLNTWSHRIKQEWAIIRENPSGLLDLLPFIGFLLFVLVSLVLAVYSYNMSSRIEQLELSMAALSQSTQQQPGQQSDYSSIDEASNTVPEVDPQWLADQVALQTDGFKNQLNDVALQLDLLSRDMRKVMQQQASAQVVTAVPTPVKTEPTPTIKPTSQETTASSTEVPKVAAEPLLLKPSASTANQSRSQEWNVNLVSLSSRDAIEGLRSQYQRQGVPVQLQAAEVSGKKIYRLRVTGFDSRDTAEAYAKNVKIKLGLAKVWVSQ